MVLTRRCRAPVWRSVPTDGIETGKVKAMLSGQSRRCNGTGESQIQTPQESINKTTITKLFIYFLPCVNNHPK